MKSKRTAIAILVVLLITTAIIVTGILHATTASAAPINPVLAKAITTSQAYQPGTLAPSNFQCGARHQEAAGPRVTCLGKQTPYTLIQLDVDPASHIIREAYLYPPSNGLYTITYSEAVAQWGTADAVQTMNNLVFVHFPSSIRIEFATQSGTLGPYDTASIIIYDGSK